MKRWTISALGCDRLELTEAETPSPGLHQVRVRVTAVSLNYRDKVTLDTGMGMNLAFPFTPASDMAGIVDAVGIGVTRFRPGDRVISTFNPEWIEGKPVVSAGHPVSHCLGGYYPGVLAEYVCHSEEWFVLAPRSLDDGGASTLPCAGLTAWFALGELSRPQPGDTVVIQGTGGVAIFGLQIAKALGATVIITSASEHKLERAKALGADHLINRSNVDWVQGVLDITAGRGADHIFELVGGSHIGRSIAAVAVSGRISLIGVMEGYQMSAPVGPLLLKSTTIQGFSVGHRRALEDFVEMIDRTGLKPVIDARFDFSEVPTALERMEQGPFGKLVIDVR